MNIFFRIFARLKSFIVPNQQLKRKLVRYSSVYHIAGTSNLNWNPIYIRKKNYSNFQLELETFKKNLVEQIITEKPLSYYKFGDGDYFFLKGLPKGSAAPGKRALSRALSLEELATYQSNSKKANAYLCEIDTVNRKTFYELFPDKNPIPAEFVYGLTANHWLTSLPFRIGLIGADTKLDIIKKLMNYEEYQNYLGIKEFTDYISVPQKFACDDLDARLKEIDFQISESSAQIFLIGVGHLKSGILSHLPNMKNAVFLDIGSGIDALAGLIDAKRPYFGSWVNYRISDDKIYDNVDLLQYEEGIIRYL